MRDIIVDEERAREWINGKDIKNFFVASNGKVVSLTTRSVSPPLKGSTTRKLGGAFIEYHSRAGMYHCSPKGINSI